MPLWTLAEGALPAANSLSSAPLLAPSSCTVLWMGPHLPDRCSLQALSRRASLAPSLHVPKNHKNPKTRKILVRCQASSCAFLYFHPGVLAALLADVAAQPAEARRLPLLLAACCDAHGLLQSAAHGAPALHMVRTLRCSLPGPSC